MRNPEPEKELTRLDRVFVTRLDVQDLASIQAAVEAGISKYGRIDALVNNAGYGAYGPLEATSLDKVRRQFDMNVLGVLATTKALLPHFRAHRSGVIVNISSGGGRITLPLGTLYHGTKFAAEGLSESLHFELAPLGVRVKIVEPGAIKTDFMSRSLDFSKHGREPLQVSRTTNEPVRCDTEDARYVPSFVIPFDDADGRVTNDDGHAYLVKWLDREIRFAKKDASVCATACLKLPNGVTLPTAADLKDPSDAGSDIYIGAKPTVTSAPRVIHGEVKF